MIPVCIHCDQKRVAVTQQSLHSSVLAACSSVILFLLLSCSSVFAHEMRPAYLELRETKAETYEVLWKVPGRGDNLRLGLYVEFPSDCKNLTEPRGLMINNALTERWSVQRPGGLNGATISIAGLTATMTDVLVRLERLDGTAQVTRLTPSAPSFIVEAAPNVLEVAHTYTVLGVEHILTGIDHLLFVLALLILTRGGWRLVKTVTAFTISHSITLTAATLGWVHLPPPPVEAVIALSIVFVAAEILRQQKGVEGITARAPWLVAFSFGLMHGLGFAGGLSEAGLPVGHIPSALLFFSLGVEIGHFLFIGIVVGLLALTRRARIPWPQWAERIPPYAIGSVAMFWVIQRTISFFTF
jgi:hydrogenase/urease accessory protein HupE